eukprot:403349555
MQLLEFLEDIGLQKLHQPLNLCHYDLAMMKEFVKYNDTYMLQSIQHSCNISHGDMDKLKRGIDQIMNPQQSLSKNSDKNSQKEVKSNSQTNDQITSKQVQVEGGEKVKRKKGRPKKSESVQIDTSLAKTQKRDSVSSDDEDEDMNLENPELDSLNQVNNKNYDEDDDDLYDEDDDEDNIEDVKVSKPLKRKDLNDLDDDEDDDDFDDNSKTNKYMSFKSNKVEGGKDIHSYLNDTDDDDYGGGKIQNLDDDDLYESKKREREAHGNSIDQDYEREHKDGGASSPDEIVKDELLYEKKHAQGKSLKPRNELDKLEGVKHTIQMKTMMTMDLPLHLD